VATRTWQSWMSLRRKRPEAWTQTISVGLIQPGQEGADFLPSAIERIILLPLTLLRRKSELRSSRGYASRQERLAGRESALGSTR
jgi:hypothetical protein